MTVVNLSTAVFLLNPAVRAIKTIYDAETPDGHRQPVQTLFKTFDTSINVGDFVIVPTSTRHNMTVVKVIEVDTEVDFNSSTKVDWVIDKIDTGHYANVLRKEDEMLRAINSADKLKKRKELADALMADHEETLKALPIASMKDDALPAPLPPTTSKEAI